MFIIFLNIVSVGNNVYNLSKHDRIQIIDTTFIKYPNIGGYIIQRWNLKYNDKDINGKIQNFIKSSKTSSPTDHSGAPSLSKSVTIFCILKQAEAFLVLVMFFVAGKGTILLILLIYLPIIKGFQF